MSVEILLGCHMGVGGGRAGFAPGIWCVEGGDAVYVGLRAPRPHPVVGRTCQRLGGGGTWLGAALAGPHVFSLGDAAPPAESILVVLRLQNRPCLPSYHLLKVEHR